MLKNFPILSDEKIEEYTRKGYVLIFRHLNAINKERPKEILNKDDFQESIKELEKYPYYEKLLRLCLLTKVTNS